MKSSTKTFSAVPVVIFALLAWFVSLGVIEILEGLPFWIRLFSHWIIVVSVYGFAFGMYYQYHRSTDVFGATATVFVTVVLTDFLFWQYVQPGDCPYDYGFLDWMVPLFLITSTVYAVGVLFHGMRRT